MRVITINSRTTEPTNTRALTFLFALLVLPSVSQACEWDTPEPFKPDSEAYIRHFAADGYNHVKVPTPSVVLESVYRVDKLRGTSCDGFATLTLTVGLPPETPYQFDELGFYFRVVEGEDGSNIFRRTEPLTPVALEAGRAVFVFDWVEYPPPNQRPLELEIEVFAVANDLSIGPSTILEVRDEPHE